jgi:bacterial/archaeal transporter family-2 protein
VAFLGILVLYQPRPLPTLEGTSGMPWWAPLGGLLGAVAVVAGLLFVNKVGAGAFAGVTITANILMSVAIDHFGLFEVEAHSLNIWRGLGAALVVAGIALVARSNSVEAGELSKEQPNFEQLASRTVQERP